MVIGAYFVVATAGVCLRWEMWKDLTTWSVTLIYANKDKICAWPFYDMKLLYGSVSGRTRTSSEVIK